MITIYGTQKRGTEFYADVPPKHEKKVEDAFYILVKNELMFGGRIVRIYDTMISVETIVLNCIDTTYFKGSKEEMEPLVAISILCEKMYKIQKELLEKKHLEVLQLPQPAGIVVWTHGLIQGVNCVKLAICELISDTTEMFEKLVNKSTEDLIALFQLKSEGLDIREII